MRRFMFPSFFGANGGPGSASSEDIRLSLDAYNRELAKLQNCPQSQISQNMSGLLGLHPQPANNNNSSANIGSGGGVGANAGSGGQPPVSNGVIQDLSLPKAERKSDIKLPNGDLSNDKPEFKKESVPTSESFSEAMKHAGSAFSLVRPKTEPG